MRKAATFRAAFAAAFDLTLVCYSRSAADTTAVQDIAVVVNPNNAVSNLSLSGLSKSYRGERQYWRANLPVVVLFRTPGTYEREVVLRTTFQMTEPQYRQYWVSKIMRAEAMSPPAELFSSGTIKEGVAAIPGAIGCVRVRSSALMVACRANPAIRCTDAPGRAEIGLRELAARIAAEQDHDKFASLVKEFNELLDGKQASQELPKDRD